MRPIGIVGLLQQIGEENIGVQNPLEEGTFLRCDKRKGYSELAFATYPELAEELFRGRTTKRLLVLVIDEDNVQAAKAALVGGME